MSVEPDLFTYPVRAGFKRSGTSQAAAEKMNARAPTLKARVLALLQKDAYTADEIAERLGITVLSARPRVAELNKMGLIYDTGLTSANASGLKAIIWRANR